MSNVLPFNDAVVLNTIFGYSRASAIGYNPDVDTATVPADAWGSSGLYPWLTTTTALEIVSTSVQDGVGGTGARTMSFTPLNSDYVVLPQVVVMNGTTPVQVGSWLRNNGGRVGVCGSNNTNVGDLILRDSGGGTIRGIILAGLGLMRQAAFTVPAGLTLLVKQLLLTVDSSGAGFPNQFASMATYFKAPTTGYILSLPIGNTSAQPYNHNIDPPIPVAEKTDFSLRITKVSDNNTIVTTGWNGYLKSNRLG